MIRGQNFFGNQIFSERLQNLRNRIIEQNYGNYMEGIAPRLFVSQEGYLVKSWTFIKSIIFTQNVSSLEFVNPGAAVRYDEIIMPKTMLINQVMPPVSNTVPTFISYCREGSTFNSCVLDPRVYKYINLDLARGGFKGRQDFLENIQECFCKLLDSSNILDFFSVLCKLNTYLFDHSNDVAIFILDSIGPNILTVGGFIPFFYAVLKFVETPPIGVKFCQDLLHEVKKRLQYKSMDTIAVISRKVYGFFFSPGFICTVFFASFAIYNEFLATWSHILSLFLECRAKGEDLRAFLSVAFAYLNNGAIPLPDVPTYALLAVVMKQLFGPMLTSAMKLVLFKACLYFILGADVTDYALDAIAEQTLKALGKQ